MDEQRTLQALVQGSERALSQIMDHYGAYVHTIIFNLIGHSLGPADVEEVMADTFFALWKNAGKVQPGKLKAYLGSLARNQAKQKLRSRGFELPLEEDILSLAAPSPEEALEEEDLAERTRQAVLDMAEPDREIFLRHYYYGQKLADIAAATGMNLSTVKTRLHRGRNRLREELTKGGGNT